MSRIIRIDSLHSGDRKSCSANGDGVRVVIWLAGCSIHCDGCHNSDYWDFDNKNFEEFSDKHLQLIFDEIDKYPNIYSGISILGGEPFDKRNIDTAIYIAEHFEKKYKYKKKDIWIWTGYTREWLGKQEGEYGTKIKYLWYLCDYAVVGPYIKEQRNISLKFRGSENQEIIKIHSEKEIK